LHNHHSTLGLATAHRKVDTALAIATDAPVQPVTLVRPHAADRAARFFVGKFPGKTLYAVKANPSPDLVRILWDAGVTHYDVASIAEVRMVARTLPEATLCFMHPVKAEEAFSRRIIRTASAPSRSTRWKSLKRSCAPPAMPPT
jgi:ornithine decarboxylase